jgi:RNA polymerase sigma factor (sigma-70 family)
MMNSKVMNAGSDDANDADLVAASLAGDRAAFGRIVGRYQSLVCAVTYSATGSLTLSEDVAQETFVAAWRQLGRLREPAKLRGWLCGIARNLLHNTLRRHGREPSQAAEPLDSASEVSSAEEAPAGLAIRREEEAILWEALERVPESYRAPLILFYREGQSVEQTAALLELSEDAVRQRLTRGRKQLADEVTAFVEGTLRRSAPGAAFAPAVLAALPPFGGPAGIAAIGGGVAQGGLGAKMAGGGSLLSSLLLSPMLVFLGNYTSYRMTLETAGTEQERNFLRVFYRRILLCSLALTILFPAAILWWEPLSRLGSILPAGIAIGVMVFSVGTIALSSVQLFRQQRRLAAGGVGSVASRTESGVVYEYRSRWILFGWPLVHLRLSRGLASRRVPAKAWIAAGDCAIGLLFAFGGCAIAPVSIGGVALGVIGFGGCAAGLLALGGGAVGFWACGGLALGWQTVGGLAIAWQSAVGGAALAQDFAVGSLARATQANTEVARQFVSGSPFYQLMQGIRPFSAGMNLLWVAPLVVWRWVLLRHARRIEQTTRR